MKKIIFFFLILILLAGCGSKPIPDWKFAGFSQLESYKKNYLNGKEQIAELHFRKSLEEIKRSGDLRIISKAHLTKYAIKVALLENIEDINDSEYLDMEMINPDLENRNFFLFLKGNFSIVDENMLPEQYRSFFRAYIRGEKEVTNNEITRISDSLSKLIAIGIIVKNNRYNEATLFTAIETASINGWKKALLIYLEKLQSYYETKNEMDKASKIKQKIKLIKN